MNEVIQNINEAQSRVDANPGSLKANLALANAIHELRVYRGVDGQFAIYMNELRDAKQG